jgi:RES domain
VSSRNSGLRLAARDHGHRPGPVRPESVVDLRDPKVQAALHTDSGELAINFRSSAAPATQELGERCAASGRIDSLLFDSPAMPGKANLAVFEAALTKLGSSLAVNDPANNLVDSLP